jgi:uncharacterized protein (TIGR03545 family)
MISNSTGRRRVWIRLGLLALLLLLVQIGVGQYVKWSVIQSAQQIVGAKVDVGGSRLPLLNGRISLRNVRVANPRAPMRNLIEAAEGEFSLDPEALLYRRAVVQQGRVRGLEFDTPRTTSGTLGDSTAEDPLPKSDWLSSKSALEARNWLDQLEDRFQQDFTDQLQAVRLTDQLLAHWPDQYAALERRVRQFHERTVEFQSQIEQAQANPLRHAKFLEDLPDRLAALRTQNRQLGRAVEALPDVADADRRAIVAARRHDEELLYDKLQFHPIDDSVLSAYLLRQQLADPMGDLIGWLSWMRRIVPADPQPSHPLHERGEDVLFAGCGSAPKLLIRSLDLAGTTRLGSQTLDFAGTLTNYASEPAMHDQPLELRLKSDGSLPLELHATIDRTGPVARDELTLNCPSVLVPAALLGESDKLRLSLAPTTASLTVSVVIEGEQISGDVQFVQQRAQILSQVGGEFQRLPMAATLQESLRGVESIETHVTLRGTLDGPQWNISSSLGPVLARAAGDAFRQAARDHASQVVAKSQQKVDEQLARLDRQIARQQQALEPQLAESTGLLDEIARHQKQDQRISYERLGNRTPAGSLFR